MAVNPHPSKLAAIERQGESPLHVMMHGLQGAKELFSVLSTEAFFSGRAIIVPDFPGFGDSGAIAQSRATLAEYVTLIEDLALSHGHREVILIGHSLGGMVATKLLRSKALQVNALVSMEGNLALDDCGNSRDIAALSESEFRSDFLPNLLAQLEASAERSAPFRLQSLRRADPATLYQISCSIVEESGSGALLRTFQEAEVPRLLLIGEKSSFSSRALGGSSKVAFVPDAGHFIIHDNYDFVLSQVVEFLKEKTGR